MSNINYDESGFPFNRNANFENDICDLFSVWRAIVSLKLELWISLAVVLLLFLPV